ncbi:hypothetical protein C8J57DRAFT_1505976 [Mycena rebaudengoi]|nr:hypothetical protein C8J57DRAFT_1505976 [Mycena rebaudengoi]
MTRPNKHNLDQAAVPEPAKRAKTKGPSEDFDDSQSDLTTSSIGESDTLQDTTSQEGPENLHNNTVVYNSGTVNPAHLSEQDVLQGVVSNAIAQELTVHAAPAAHTQMDAALRLCTLGVYPPSLAGKTLGELNVLLEDITTSGLTAVNAHTPAIESSPPDVVQPRGAAADSLPLRVSVNGGTTVTKVAEFAAAIALFKACGVAESRIKGWSLDTMKRVYALLTRCDKAKHIYSVNKLPADATYGPKAVFGNKSNIVCAKGSAEPVRVWVVGEWVTGWWLLENGALARRLSVNICPLSTSHLHAAKAVLKAFSIPQNSCTVIDGFGPEQIKVNKWMTCNQHTPPVEFTDIYDARLTFQSKNMLDRLSISALKERDVVLVELEIHKYQEKLESSTAKKPVYGDWLSTYNLLTIYVLKDADTTGVFDTKDDDFQA